jgi:hypothetical protein
MRFSCLLLVLLLHLAAKSQSYPVNFIKDLIESLAEDLPEDYDFSELEERLIFFNKHPINLNHTTIEELKSLALLSPIQIGYLFSHIKENGKLIDILELQGITNFDLETIQRILPFVTLNQADLVDRITYQNLSILGNHDVVVRFSRVLEKLKGFGDLSGSKYLGTPERFLFRYKYNLSNRLSASLIMEKDAGEEFLKGTKQLLFDYQSAHLAVYNARRFKKIVIGDYIVQFGQALTLWSGFAFGKAPDVASVVKKDVGLKAYTSANEYSFFRGLGTTVNLYKHLDLTTFISFRNFDASLSLDNEGKDVVTTINETGLHRTSTEIKNKNSLAHQLYGGVIQFQNHNLGIGAIAYHTSFSKSFITAPQVYALYNFKGNELTNVGLFYNYTYKNIYFFGETGKSLHGGLAHINGILISLSAKVSAVALYRNYQKNYYNFYNQATAEASKATNENGLYAGLNIALLKSLTFSCYADHFTFPWLKFRIDAPSNGYEILGQLTYSPSKTLKAFLRYKSELKQQNTDVNTSINYLDGVKKESYRADINWRLNRFFSFQNRIECTQFQKGDADAEFGYMCYQDVDYSPLFSKISGNIRIAYFNTPSFNSRIYAYEDDVLYNFSFGMYSGKGFRSYLNLKYKLAKKLDLWTRCALFYYPNQSTVGSGLDEIIGNKKSEVKLQLRYQF